MAERVRETCLKCGGFCGGLIITSGVPDHPYCSAACYRQDHPYNCTCEGGSYCVEHGSNGVRDRLIAKLADRDAAVDGLGANLSALSAENAALESDAVTLRAEVFALSESNAALLGQLAEVKARATRIESAVRAYCAGPSMPREQAAAEMRAVLDEIATHLARSPPPAADPPKGPSVGTEAALSEVRAERVRQTAKWGEQNHPDGTASAWWREFGLSAHVARSACQAAAARGNCTYLLILLEEVCEAFDEVDPAKLREEMVQVAAVAVRWIEALDRRVGRALDPLPPPTLTTQPGPQVDGWSDEKEKK